MSSVPYLLHANMVDTPLESIVIVLLSGYCFPSSGKRQGTKTLSVVVYRTEAESGRLIGNTEFNRIGNVLHIGVSFLPNTVTHFSCFPFRYQSRV